MTNVEAFHDVTHEILDRLKVDVSNGATGVQNEDHVNTEALGAALFQLVARLDEVVHVASGAVVLLPEVGLTLDVTWDAVVVIASLKTARTGEIISHRALEQLMYICIVLVAIDTGK